MTLRPWSSQGKRFASWNVVRASLLLLAPTCLAGCGGGAGGAGLANSPTPATITPAPGASGGSDDISRFIPNYAADLTQARRWNKSAVTLRVVAPAGTRAATDHAAIFGQGVALWSPYTAPHIRLVNTTASNADITVTFVAAGSLPNGAIGRTEVTFGSNNNALLQANIRIDATLAPDVMAQVAAHELGHALGLEGHSRGESDLMFMRSHLPALVTVRDANTFAWGYRDTGRSATPGGNAIGDVSVLVSECGGRTAK